MEFLKYWLSSRGFNKLVIKAKNACGNNFFWSFLCCIKIQYDFLALRDLVVCMKTKFFFLWKPGILIPDLYFYGIKIQPDINQNGIKKCMGKSQIFPKWFLNIFFWLGRPGPKKGWAEINPKMKLGQDRPKSEPSCGWTQPNCVGWADVLAQKNNSGLLCM